MLRGAGYFEHALYVAQAAGQADWYLDILLGDCESYDESLVYLQGLPRAEAGAALKKHGKVPQTNFNFNFDFNSDIFYTITAPQMSAHSHPVICYQLMVRYRTVRVS